MNQIILITCTFDRPKRLQMLQKCANCFKLVKNIFWVLVEDGSSIDPEVQDFLVSTKIPFVYLHYGPTRDKGHMQRDVAMCYIYDNNLNGIIYNADDDNGYDIRLFDEIRKVKTVAVLPVGNLGPNGIERPIVVDGKIVDWDCDWKSRKYPVDMAGFAFHSDLLKNIQKPFWNIGGGRGGETDFLSRIVPENYELEVLCDNATKCFVWHNENLSL